MNAFRLLLLLAGFSSAIFINGYGQHEKHDDEDHVEHQEASSESDHAQHEHDEHDDKEGSEGATFKEGRGLEFPSEVIAALDVRTVKVVLQQLAPTIQISAQVYATGNAPRALAWVSPPQAKKLTLGLKTDDGNAELIAISHTAEQATGQTELIFSFSAGQQVHDLGDTLPLHFTLSHDSLVTTVPRSALLDTATGTFVYIVTAPAYLRTAVEVGLVEHDFVEIIEGVHEGDTVVTTPVNQLWLTELRLTKGGGHSH